MRRNLTKKPTILILSIILLFGLLLRIYNLDKESLWIDEAYALKHAEQKIPVDVITDVVSIEGSPPGYFLLLHYWIKLFGNSEFAIRFPSLLFGVLSILIIFQLARLLLDNKIALLSSFFLATSLLQVLYSQEARLYSMFTFLTLLSAYSFAQWYQNNNERYLILYFITILLAIYTNYLTITLILLYTLLLLFLLPSKITFPLLKSWFLTHLLLFILSLPLLKLIPVQYSLINTGLVDSLVKKGLPVFLAKLGIFFYALPSAIILLFFLFILLLKNYTLKKSLLEVLEKINFNDYLFSFLLVIVGISYLYAVFKPFSLFGIPIIKNQITHSYFLIRHSLFLTPIISLYLAYKIINLKRLTTFCLVFIILVNTFSLSVYYQTPTKAEWEEAMDFIHQKESNPLLLLDKGGNSHRFLADYYSPQKNNIIRLTSSERTRQGRISQDITLKDLFIILEDYESFWLILARNNNQDYKVILDSKYQLDLSKEFYQLKVYHYATGLQ